MTEEKSKDFDIKNIKLNPNAKEFKPSKSLESKLYNQQNNPNINYAYPAYGYNNQMAPGPAPYPYQYPNNIQYPIQAFNNNGYYPHQVPFNPMLQRNSYPIQPMNYPHNNRNHKYNKNSGNQYYNQNKNKDFKEESKKNNESSALTKTLLNKDSRPFIPPSIKNKIKEEKKEELKLNLDAESYLPNNTQLIKQEKEVHPDKEEKNLNKEKDKEKDTDKDKEKTPLTKLLESKGNQSKIPDKTTKTYITRDSKKNSTSGIRKKQSKNELNKKIDQINAKEERIKREEQKEKKRKEEEQERIRKEQERLRKEEEENKKKLEEEKRKEKEEEEKNKVIEKKYFITFKNKKNEKNEYKYTFEYIMQFKNWKICKEDELLTKESKDHFDGFKEEVKEGGKKKKDNNGGKKDNYAKIKIIKENPEKKVSNEPPSMKQWARMDMTKEIKMAELYKENMQKENQVDIVQKDLRHLLNSMTKDNYKEKKDEILKLIQNSVENQDKFLEVLFQKAVLEKAYVNLYANLVKELDKVLEPKSKKEGDKEAEKKKKKEHSEMRSHLIDKCRTIFIMEKNSKINEYIKGEDPKERKIKLKKFMLGNVYFIAELIKIKILSRKVGLDCLKNLFERYEKGKNDDDLREITLEAIIIFTDRFASLIHQEEKNDKIKNIKEFSEKIDETFKKLEDIKNEKGLVGHIKYKIINLIEKRSNDFAMSKFEESELAKSKKELQKQAEIEGQISQDDINERIKKELNVYKNCLENEDENVDPWEQTSYLIKKRINYGKTFGDILEGYFVSVNDIFESEKNLDFVKKYIDELVEFYEGSFGNKDRKELNERMLKLALFAADVALDFVEFLEIYAYVLNTFIRYDLVKISDFAEWEKEDITIENINNILKYLSKIYEENDFKAQVIKLPFVEKNQNLFSWVYEEDEHEQEEDE